MTNPHEPGPPGRPPLEVLRERRRRLLDRIGDAVVVVAAAPELQRAHGAEVPYRQDTDFFYLTGLEEPGAIAVLTPHDPEQRFTLFVQPRDPTREVWNGPRLGVERAREVLGADAAYPADQLDRAAALLRPAERVYCGFDPGAGPHRRVLDLVARAREGRARSGTGPTTLIDLDAVLSDLRRTKDADEVERMRVAAKISADGHLAAIRSTRPGRGEWEIQAVLESTFRSRGATGPAFASIVGSGANATVLHYTTNSRRVASGELVLIDAGAEWGMYCSDITRTFPASGRFTPEQRALYEVVLAAERAGIDMVRPGSSVQAVHDAAVRVLTEGMLRLGLIAAASLDEALESGAYRKFYMHQTSHWLGLNVHDVGLYREGGEPVPFEPGMVLTVEPGIYIAESEPEVEPGFRGIGIRIEDSVLVTADGCDVLTRAVPTHPDELAALVGTG